MTLWRYGGRRPRIDPNGSWIFPSADVIGKVEIGPNVYVGANAVIRGDYGKIIIKEGTAIEESVTVHARPGGTTLIEEDVTVGHAAMLHNCTLRKGCIVGMNSTVTDYAEVGEDAIVAEGAVVKARSKIPAGKVAAGIPAKVIGDVNPKHTQFWKATKEMYQQLAKDYPRKLKEMSWEDCTQRSRKRKRK